MGVVCATAEKYGLVKKSTAVKLKASDYVGLPNNTRSHALKGNKYPRQM